MTLSELGSVGEFVGAIAVLVTLVYLAIQIRQAMAATRAQVRQSLADSQLQYVSLRATDPFLRQAAGKMFAGQEIDDSETFGLGMHVAAGIRLFENYYAQYGMGTMDPEDWRAMREVIRFHFQFPQYRQMLELMEQTVNREFARELTRIIEEINGEAV